jgi:heterotetrameric sarcosine oxidase gamma subunit
VPDHVVVTSSSGVALAAILARKGFEAAAARKVGAEGPRYNRNGPHAFIGVGPGHWLALSEERPIDFIESLRKAFGDAARVVDQSGAYVVFRIVGSKARSLLQRGVGLDLHPEVFVMGSAASASIAHINALLWRLEEPSSFAVAVFRSYEVSFRDWLDFAIAGL